MKHARIQSPPKSLSDCGSVGVWATSLSCMINDVSVLVDIKYIIFSFDELSNGYCPFLAQFYVFFSVFRRPKTISIEFWAMKTKNGRKISVEFRKKIRSEWYDPKYESSHQNIGMIFCSSKLLWFSLSPPCVSLFAWQIVGQTETRRWNIFQSVASDVILFD